MTTFASKSLVALYPSSGHRLYRISLFVWNFFRSVVRGAKAAENPWEVGTLEWSLPSPPPHHNFDVVPVVVRGPHELSGPEVKKRLGRDWVGQSEVLPEPESAESVPPPAAIFASGA